MVMNLQDIIAELDNIIEQASSDDEIGKESILEALTDVVRDAKGDELDFSVEDEDHFALNCDLYADIRRKHNVLNNAEISRILDDDRYVEYLSELYKRRKELK